MSYGTHLFKVSVKKTGTVIRSIPGYGEDRKAARRDARRIFRAQYDTSCCELEA